MKKKVIDTSSFKIYNSETGRIVGFYNIGELQSDVSANVYTYKGTVEKFSDLPKGEDVKIGDTYNVLQKNGNIPAGTNYAWDGDKWDELGGEIDLSEFPTKDEVDKAISDEKERATKAENELQSRIEDVESNQESDLSKITELQGKLNGVSDVKGELDKKANKQEVYTKTDVDLINEQTNERLTTLEDNIKDKASKTDIEIIKNVIPVEASSKNQLVDYNRLIKNLAIESENIAQVYATKTELDSLDTFTETINQGLGEAEERLDADEERLDYIESELPNKANVSDLSNVISEEIVDETTFEDYKKVTREELKKDLFIDLWNSAVGKYGTYNKETGYFELNELTDINYEEAVNIYNISIQYGSVGSFQKNLQYAYATPILSKVRTVFPIANAQSDTIKYDFSYMFIRRTNLINITIDITPSTYNEPYVYIDNLKYCFYDATKLRKVLGQVLVGATTSLTECFGNCHSLETIHIKNLQTSIDIKKCLLFKFESLSYIVNEAKNTSPITIKVHQDIYNALTGNATYPFNEGTQEEWEQLLQDATEKNISFVTA